MSGIVSGIERELISVSGIVSGIYRELISVSGIVWSWTQGSSSVRRSLPSNAWEFDRGLMLLSLSL